MRLASKIFLTSAVVVLVLAAAALYSSLRALDHLSSANREITDRAVRAARLTSSLRDAMRKLSRLDANYVILRDSRYAEAWYEKATQVEADLDELKTLVSSQGERAALT